MPTGKTGRSSIEITFALHNFFYGGGLEGVAELAGWSLPIKRIKEKSNEPY
jgi:hypothetical protein